MDFGYSSCLFLSEMFTPTPPKKKDIISATSLLGSVDANLTRSIWQHNLATFACEPLCDLLYLWQMKPQYTPFGRQQICGLCTAHNGIARALQFGLRLVDRLELAVGYVGVGFHY